MKRKLMALLVLFGTSAVILPGKSIADTAVTDFQSGEHPIWICYASNDAGKWFEARGDYRYNVRTRVMNKCAEQSLNCHFEGCDPIEY